MSIGTVLAMALLAVGIGPAAAQSSQAIEACVGRGIAYFKEIGSYPRLSDGRSAAQVARERCNRTTTAFP